MKKLLLILACEIVSIALVVTLVSWLSWQPQSWYAPPDFSKPEIAQLADHAEYRLNEEFHKIRPVDETWRLRITDEAVNAWLSGRLVGWLTHDQEIELPPELHDPQVQMTLDGVWIAAMVNISQGKPRPIALLLRVWIESGKAFVEPVSVRLGKIPLPLSVFGQVVKDIQNQTDGIDAFAPLMDDREVEIKSIEFEEGAIVLTCQTHLPKN